MVSSFDAAWAPETAFLGSEMGETVFIEGVKVEEVVVSEVERGSKSRPPVVNSGVLFTIWLTVAQMAEFTPGGVEGMKGKRVKRGTVSGRINTVLDLGGAGGEFAVGPESSR